MTVRANEDSGQRKRVVVAMSGGVDSSVAAALLVEQGYDVIGMMMRLWSEPGHENVFTTNRCCTPDQMADARRVADRLKIHFYVLDFQQPFRRKIVQFFIDEHAAGRTPNPCIECNRQIRFTALFNHALALEAEYMATGHYARIEQINSDYRLLRALDEAKDQSYVLHVLGQQQLARTLFPIGRYMKTEVRDLARRFDLPVAVKQESQDLCFVSDGDHRRFLREYSRHPAEPGPILDQDGRELGRHQGVAFYTIGQRKGLGVSSPTPLYVLRKDLAKNALIVGPRQELGRRELFASNVNWVSGHVPARPLQAQVKIRYTAKPAPAVVTALNDDFVRVQFTEPVLGITPGQGAVFYEGQLCVGGGIISSDEIAGVSAGNDMAMKVAI